jgi:hypothetical protein
MSIEFTHNGHRYKLDGKPVPGVTTLLGGGIPKPALMYWAANTAAQYAIDHPGASYDEIRKAHTVERDTAGIRGTAVHDLAEQLVHGEAVEVHEELEPYVDGYLRFLDDWGIVPILTEKVIGSRRDWYAGRFDLIATSPHLNNGRPVMIDLKTSSGVYGETALQCAAYSLAEFWQDDDGAEHPLPEIVASYVAHVTPDGTVLYQLAADRDQMARHLDMFRAAAFTHRTSKERDNIITEPLTTPTHEMSRAS